MGTTAGAPTVCRTPREEDLATEAAVLASVLDAHPTRLTLAELVRELAGEEPGFAAADAIRRAARDLGGLGLVHLRGGFVSPTRAALRYTELLER